MAIFGFLAACVVSFACLSKKSSQTDYTGKIFDNDACQL